MLVPMKEMLVAAKQGGYAVPGFNYYDQATVDGIVEEAEAQLSPTVLMVSGIYLESMGFELALALALQAAKRAKTPVAVHLDHGTSFELAEACVKGGFTSVMIDGSHSPYAENVALTRRVVEMAHAKGVTVEAELGAVGGVEDVDSSGSAGKLVLIDPLQARDYVESTGIDALAPAIGNVHGLPSVEPKLNMELLKQVRAAVDVPLVMHGGSGISDDVVRELVRNGMNKLNIGTELKVAWRKGLAAYFAEDKYEPRFGMQSAKACVRQVVAHKVGLAGSAGKA